MQCSGHEPGTEKMNGTNERTEENKKTGKCYIDRQRQKKRDEGKRHIRFLIAPIRSLYLSHGAEPDVRTSVPSVSLSKSPRLRADVSRSPELPSTSLETALNRWPSQQVQESAQVPHARSSPSPLLLYSNICTSFLCP